MTGIKTGSVEKTVWLATGPSRPARASTPRTYDVVVIGAGPAGVSAAVRTAEIGARTVLVEAARVGGLCEHGLRADSANWPAQFGCCKMLGQPATSASRYLP
ncbi:FAD-dependent oxidoreductase [Pengzhenrongella frigida]|uniref:FAD-dependent oxidoreductase n=1 Tax=Pengzhenrongella frigida TaxID=1259133 RepID=UPI0026986ABC|nr:FAD-dependent oxidoreductase [Cellulomonas sp. HLT2-17]